MSLRTIAARFPATRRCSVGAALLLLLLSIAAPLARSQTNTQDFQFSVTLPGESFARFCPADPLPVVEAFTDDFFDMTFAIVPPQDVQLTARMVDPEGRSTPPEDFNAFVTPALPLNVFAGESVEGSVFWGLSGLTPGSYRLELIASETGGERFSVCSVPIVLGRGCTLLEAVDTADGDTEVDLGVVGVGSSATEFVFGILGAADPSSEDRVRFCPSTNSQFLFDLGAFETEIAVTFAPTVTGPAETELIVFHVDDVTGDPCVAGAAESNRCVKSLAVRGVAERLRLSLESLGFSCANPPAALFDLRNDGDSELSGLSAFVPAPLLLRSLDDLPVVNFSLGPRDGSGGPSSRQLWVEFPSGAPPPGAALTIAQSGGEVARAALSQPPCAFVDARQIDFGQVTQGDQATASVTVSNAGSTEIVLDPRIEPSGSDFETAAGEITIPPGGDRLVEIVLRPSSPGVKRATLVLTNVFDGQQLSVGLQGAAVAPEGPRLSFENGGRELTLGQTLTAPATPIGGVGELEIIVTNRSARTLEGLSASVSTSEFSVSPTRLELLSPGGVAVFSVAFRPSRSGIATSAVTFMVAGEAFPFSLQAEGTPPATSFLLTDLPPALRPIQTEPYAAVGLQLSAPAFEHLEGELTLVSDSSLLGGADPSVRFVDSGSQIRFQISAGETAASFPNEPDDRRARYQTGTVAGAIRFFVTGLQTADGEPVALPDGEVGSIEVLGTAPTILSSAACRRTADGVVLDLPAVSPTRSVLGVEVDLEAAVGAELDFVPPAPDFANGVFESWFAGADSRAHGGAFRLSLPIRIAPFEALGAATIRLQNDLGWSSAARFAAASCR